MDILNLKNGGGKDLETLTQRLRDLAKDYKQIQAEIKVNSAPTKNAPLSDVVYTITDGGLTPIVVGGIVTGYTATRTITRRTVPSGSTSPLTYSNIYASRMDVNAANIPQPPATVPDGTGNLPEAAKYAAHFNIANLSALFADGSNSINVPLRWVGLPANASPTPLDATYEQMTEDMLSNQPAATQVASHQAFINAYNAAPAAARAPWLAAFNAATTRLATLRARMGTPAARGVLTGEIHFVYFERLENGAWVNYLRVEHVSNAILDGNNENVIPARGVRPKYYREDHKGNRSPIDPTMATDSRNLRIGLDLLMARCGNTSFFSLGGGTGVLSEGYKYPQAGAIDAGAYYVTVKMGTRPPGINIEVPDWNDFNFTPIQNAAIALCTANQYSPAVAEGYRQRAHRAVVRQIELLDNLRALSAANGNPVELQNLINVWQGRVTQNQTTLDTLAQFQADANCFTLPVVAPAIAPISANINFQRGTALENTAGDLNNFSNTVAATIATNIAALPSTPSVGVVTVPVPNEAPLQIQRTSTPTGAPRITSIRFDFLMRSANNWAALQNDRVAAFMASFTTNANLIALCPVASIVQGAIVLDLLANPATLPATGNLSIVTPVLTMIQPMTLTENLLNPL